MDINDRLYVEIHPMTSGQIPHPHPVDEAGFDLLHVYKVLGMYNPSETSECYMVLSNPKRQIWFIPQRHLLAYALLDSSELCLSLENASLLRLDGHQSAPKLEGLLVEQKSDDLNGHGSNGRLRAEQIS